jgi:D-alanyl-D-alanine carboxypeptidase
VIESSIKMQKLQAALNHQIGKGNIHNVVAAVQSFDRNINFVGAAGVANPVSGAVMNPDTPYFIASVTKMYTAAIIIRLCQEKRIDLDAPITKYLPDSMTRGIHIFKGNDYSDRIKVANLIEQSSGLADHEADKPRGGKSILDDLKAGNDRYIETADAIQIVRGLPSKFPPGTGNQAYYSNTNYRILGAIIETITGKPMAQNFKEMIIEPLGLHHTYLFDWKASQSDEAIATIFLNNTPTYVPKYLSSNISDGGLVSTASECVTFLRAFFDGRLFDKSFLEKMMHWKSIFFPLRYGYGLMYFKLPRFFWPTPLPEFIGHSGSTGSFAFVCPSKSMYLAGTVNQITNPSKPFFLMINLVRAAG